jgi:hypothetical protein
MLRIFTAHPEEYERTIAPMAVPVSATERRRERCGRPPLKIEALFHHYGPN